MGNKKKNQSRKPNANNAVGDSIDLNLSAVRLLSSQSYDQVVILAWRKETPEVYNLTAAGTNPKYRDAAARFKEVMRTVLVKEQKALQDPNPIPPNQG